MRAFSGIEAVLFDLDGTLIDSAPDLAAAADQMRTTRGLPSLPAEMYRPMAGAGARGMIGVAFGLKPEDDGYLALRDGFFDNYEANIADHSTLFDGVPELLAGIEAAGVQWGVVTNKPKRFTDPLLPLIGLDHAACSISGDTTAHAKPHPAPLLEAAARLGLAPHECWYVGDDLRDIQAGRAAGMRTVAATYGYMGEQAEVARWDADAAIASPMELLKLLKQA